MDALLHGMLKLGMSRAPNETPKEDQNDVQTSALTVRQKTLIVEPMKVVDSEGKLYVQYPSRTDLQFDDIEVKRFKE